jgi:DNA-binding MarR family transcriptional regulator
VLEPSTRASVKPRRADRETIARAGDHRALRVWLRLLTCTQLIERHVRARLRRRFGTTLPRFDLMSQLERHPEGLKMNRLSRLLMVSGGNVTGITDQLVKEGLVERLPEPSDRRAFRIRLTPDGDRAFAEMAREHEEWVVEILSGSGRREQDELLELLAKVKQHAIRVAESDTRQVENRGKR